MTTTPEPKTPEQIIAEALHRSWDDATGYEGAERIIAATLRDSGLLVGAPTEEQIEAAAEAILEASFGQELPESPADLARAALNAALTAAAGVAPQAECGEHHPYRDAVCVLPRGHEPGHMCEKPAPQEQSETAQRIKREWLATHEGSGFEDLYSTEFDRMLTGDAAADPSRDCHECGDSMCRCDVDWTPAAPFPDREKLIAEKAEAWEEGVATALNHAKRGSDGITLKLVTFDGDAWPNPYRSDAALAAQPVLDPEKVAGVIRKERFGWMRAGSGKSADLARALCEAYEKGELS